jgi:hypothetical protein
MPGAAINDSSWAKMTAAHRCEAVRAGRATLRQTVEGLLDGPDELVQACTEILTRTDASLKDLTDTQLPNGDPADGSLTYRLEQEDLTTIKESEPVQERVIEGASQEREIIATKRRRLGLPRGYLPRLH